MLKYVEIVFNNTLNQVLVLCYNFLRNNELQTFFILNQLK
jgi:hypothetical protein